MTKKQKHKQKLWLYQRMNSAISVGFDSHSSYLTFIYNICPLQALARRPKRAFYPVFFLLWRSWVIFHTLQKNILRCHPSNSNWNKKKCDHHFRSLHIKGKLKPKKKNKVIQLERSAVATMHILQRAKLICECCHCNKKKKKEDDLL